MYYIYGINGPVVTVRGGTGLLMSEMVFVGENKLIGEVVSVDSQQAVVQVYESTTGLKVSQPVTTTGAPMSVKLGPGLLNSIFDGIGRPLEKIAEREGAFITPGSFMASIDPDKLWQVTVTAKAGDELRQGQIYATLPETPAVLHKCMVPLGVCGRVVKVMPSGQYKDDDTVVVLQDEQGAEHNLTLCQQHTIRRPRPFANRLPINMPLITGQRIIDTLFPIAKGGTAALPGPFGAGKTITQHQLAKWSDADIIIYLGCGERGNEMTQALEEFSTLIDPRRQTPLMNRTILIANTSNMPVAAREASIYTGMTMAEYYRDMGYHVAIMADSTSRWAEALREISGRLEEMPAEEGFPAYLPSRLAQFYERAGYVETFGGQTGSITVIGAVSPQGGDFSEPVTQATKRFIRCFWALDRELAYARHFPAINYNDSYSEYTGELKEWYDKNVSPDFLQCRQQMMDILNEESSIMEIAKLIGADVLPEEQKLVLDIARVIRLGFLQQNAYHQNDSFVTMEKQLRMMQVILYLNKQLKQVVAQGIPLSYVRESGILDKLIMIKYDIPNEKPELIDAFYGRIDQIIGEIE